MVDQLNAQKDVKILPPDQTLQRKLGGVKLDVLFSPEAVQVAQEVIVSSAADFLQESFAELRELEKAAATLSSSPKSSPQALTAVIASSFSLKAKAGLGGYSLVSTLANSLVSRCELLGEANLTPTNLAIIRWHVDSMNKLLIMKIAGTGGTVGEAILTELTTLAAAIGQTPPMNKDQTEAFIVGQR